VRATTKKRSSTFLAKESAPPDKNPGYAYGPACQLLMSHCILPRRLTFSLNFGDHPEYSSHHAKTEVYQKVFIYFHRAQTEIWSTSTLNFSHLCPQLQYSCKFCKFPEVVCKILC